MRLSEETKEIHRNRIRRILVMKPDATICETQSILNSGKNPLKLDKDYINRIIRKIRKRQGERLKNYTVNKVLASFEEEVGELKKQLWVTINQQDATNSEKTLAIRELRNSSKDLFDKMFDAGIFEKKLGEVRIGLFDYTQNKKDNKKENEDRTNDSDKTIAENEKKN